MMSDDITKEFTERCSKAVEELGKLAAQRTSLPTEYHRLMGKIEGVKLAQSYAADYAALTERVRVLTRVVEQLVRLENEDGGRSFPPRELIADARAALHSPPAQAGQARGRRKEDNDGLL